MSLFPKAVIVLHRYLGIALCLLVAMWFASGMVMMYAGGMPRLAPELRLERLPEVDMSGVRLSVAQAAERAGLDSSVGWGGGREPAGRVLLISVLDRPVYRFGEDLSVYADTGEVLDELTLEQSRAVAAGFANLPMDRIRYEATLTEVDQWTLGQSRQMPQYKFAVDDGAGTELYVQPLAGEVSMHTTARTRALAWMGVIPHWLYFRPLRVNQPLWYRIVVWTSAAACVLTVLGLILGFTQMRRPKPFRLQQAIPYRGWMRWHYVTGVLFGVTTLTFAYSGLLSMEPFAWTGARGLEVRRDVFTGGALEFTSFPSVDAAAWTRVASGRVIKEVEFARIQDEPYYIVRYEAGAQAVRRERLHQPYDVSGLAERERDLVSADTMQARRMPFSVESLATRLQAAIPGVPIVEQQLLTDYDNYYYSRAELTPLPALRVKFGDPLETWVYIDPEMSQVLSVVHRLNRLERWLYSALHNFDFRVLYDYRPLWDIVMLVLCLGGLASSGIGAYLGIKRMVRGTHRLAGARRRLAVQLAHRAAHSPKNVARSDETRPARLT
jgi:hypothetical protein